MFYRLSRVRRALPWYELLDCFFRLVDCSLLTPFLVSTATYAVHGFYKAVVLQWLFLSGVKHLESTSRRRKNQATTMVRSIATERSTNSLGKKLEHHKRWFDRWCHLTINY